jgi:hypothetical protein
LPFLEKVDQSGQHCFDFFAVTACPQVGNGVNNHELGLELFHHLVDSHQVPLQPILARTTRFKTQQPFFMGLSRPLPMDRMWRIT